jgi:hypothetical protein
MRNPILPQPALGVSIINSGRDPYQGDFARYAGPQPDLVAAGIAPEKWFPVPPKKRAWGRDDAGQKWAVTAHADGIFHVTRRAVPAIDASEPPPSNVVRLPAKSMHALRRQPETNTCHMVWDVLDLAKEGAINGVVLAACTRDGEILIAGADCRVDNSLGRELAAALAVAARDCAAMNFRLGHWPSR